MPDHLGALALPSAPRPAPPRSSRDRGSRRAPSGTSAWTSGREFSYAPARRRLSSAAAVTSTRRLSRRRGHDPGAARRRARPSAAAGAVRRARQGLAPGARRAAGLGDDRRARPAAGDRARRAAAGSTWCWPAATTICPTTRAPLVVQVHEAGWFEPELRDLLGRRVPGRHRAAHRAGGQPIADRVIVPSRRARLDLIEDYGLAPEKVRAVHHGADPMFTPADAAGAARRAAAGAVRPLRRQPAPAQEPGRCCATRWRSWPPRGSRTGWWSPAARRPTGPTPRRSSTPPPPSCRRARAGDPHQRPVRRASWRR